LLAQTPSRLETREDRVSRDRYIYVYIHLCKQDEKADEFSSEGGRDKLLCRKYEEQFHLKKCKTKMMLMVKVMNDDRVCV